MKKPDSSHLKTYLFTRAYNVRVYENGVGKFASDDEAVSTAREAHFGPVTDITGADVKFTRAHEDEPTMFDLSWIIDHKNGEIRTVVDNSALCEDYVSTDDMYDLLKKMSELDPDWPGDWDKIKGLFGRAKNMMSAIDKQAELEGKTWQNQT